LEINSWDARHKARSRNGSVVNVATFVYSDRRRVTLCLLDAGGKLRHTERLASSPPPSCFEGGKFRRNARYYAFEVTDARRFGMNKHQHDTRCKSSTWLTVLTGRRAKVTNHQWRNSSPGILPPQRHPRGIKKERRAVPALRKTRSESSRARSSVIKRRPSRIHKFATHCPTP